MNKFRINVSMLFVVFFNVIFAQNNTSTKTTIKPKPNVEINVEKKIEININTEKKNNTNNQQNNTNTKENKPTNNTNTTNNSSNSINAYSKYDFVSGEKIIAIEDFSNTNLGDFPLRWNTNGSAEVVNLSNQAGNWLEISQKTTLLPEFIKNLPENFTFEFDLACTQPFSLYTQEFSVGFVTMPKPATDFAQWTSFKRGASGFVFGVHPLYASSKIEGVTVYKMVDANKEVMKNKANQSQFNVISKPTVHVAIWRQNDRIRIYLNEDKVWDLPKAFANTKHNGIVFYSGAAKTDDNKYYISNIKFAIGAADTRSKLLDEGKFSTNGILFDVNSDKIKPASYGILKEIAAALNENPNIKIKIVGHTDSDGDDTSNLSLSKKRADAVKNMLGKEFKVDTKSIETEGKGATQPIDKANTKEAKANNRRVELIKL